MPAYSAKTNNSKNADTSQATVLDLIGTSCPMAFVKARLFLDAKSNNETVEIQYEDTAANEPLVRSIKALGHIVTPVETAFSNRDSEKTDEIKILVQVKKE